MMSSDGTLGDGSGVSAEDWRRLYNRVLPNPLSMEEFAHVLAGGTVHESYLAKDLHKIMQELRDILKEHGELREAANFPLSGRKAELGKAAAVAIQLMRAGGSGPAATAASASGPLPHRRTGAASSSPAAEEVPADSGAQEGPGRSGSNSPLIGHSPPEGGLRAPNPSLHPTPGKSTRPPPITDHILDSSGGGSGNPQTEDPSGSNANGSSAATGIITTPSRTNDVRHTTSDSSPPAPPHSGPKPRANYNRAWKMNTDLSRTLAQNASRERSELEANGGGGTRGDADGADAASAVDARRSIPDTVADRVQSLIQSSTTLHSVASEATVTTAAAASAAVHGTGAPAPLAPVGPSTGLKNELAVLNDRAPPFFQILSVVRRFQLRYGSHPLKFEVPIQYAQAIATRRLRLYVIPLRHPNIPSRWPVAKEIVVYVNDQCVTTPWRRSWPERKEEVAKTFLPLDVTQLVNRSHPQQRLQIDIFNKDYFTPALLAVVQTFTLEEVVESLLEREVGEGQLEKVQSRLLSAPFPPAQGTGKVAANDALVARFYQRVMEDDVDDGLEVDDPIITTKCPISQMPIEIPVRGRECGHLQCVDLSSYLVSCHKGSYWNCALCDRELRPSAIMVDTILWRYLMRSAAKESSGTPHHLRLSLRTGTSAFTGGSREGDEGIVTAGEAAAALCKYVWHPSRGHHGETDVLIDDDEGEGRGTQSGQDDDEMATAQREQLAQAREASAQRLLAQRALDHDRFLERTGGEKRPREESPPLPDGSFDNPIEL